MSYLLVKQKSIDRIKIQESEILESLHSLKIKILKSDLKVDGKHVSEDYINILENVVRDFFAIEYVQIKKVGNA